MSVGIWTVPPVLIVLVTSAPFDGHHRYTVVLPTPARAATPRPYVTAG